MLEDEKYYKKDWTNKDDLEAILKTVSDMHVCSCMCVVREMFVWQFLCVCQMSTLLGRKLLEGCDMEEHAD